jgi:hypothetical protein
MLGRSSRGSSSGSPQPPPPPFPPPLNEEPSDDYSFKEFLDENRKGQMLLDGV